MESECNLLLRARGSDLGRTALRSELIYVRFFRIPHCLILAADSLDAHACGQIHEIEAGNSNSCCSGADERFVSAKHLIAALNVPAFISKQYQELGQYHGRRCLFSPAHEQAATTGSVPSLAPILSR